MTDIKSATQSFDVGAAATPDVSEVTELQAEDVQAFEEAKAAEETSSNGNDVDLDSPVEGTISDGKITMSNPFLSQVK